MQAAPGASLEVVEAEFFLELLVGLLAWPTRLDGRGKLLKGGVCRVVGEVELALAGGAVLAHEPALLAGQMLRAGRLRPVGDTHTPDRERCPQRPFGAGASRARAELGVGRVGELGLGLTRLGGRFVGLGPTSCSRRFPCRFRRPWASDSPGWSAGGRGCTSLRCPANLLVRRS